MMEADATDSCQPRGLRCALRVAAIAAAFVHPTAHALARSSVAIDLVSQFQSVGLVVSIVALVLLVALRSRAAWLVAAVAVVQCAPWLDLSLPAGRRAPTEGRPSLRLLIANILYVNHDHAALRRVIETEQPDVIGFIEVSQHHLDAIADLAAFYPVRFEAPSETSHGLAFWSKNRLDGPVDRIRLSDDAAPMLRVQIHVDNQRVRFYLVHTNMPFVRLPHESGFDELSRLTEELASVVGPVIAAGDFNTTDSSPHFEDLMRRGRLVDSRLGFGPQPSWPTWSPLRLTIDHALVSRDLVVTSRRLASDCGSDHAPVVVDLALAAPPPDPSAARTASTKKSQP